MWILFKLIAIGLSALARIFSKQIFLSLSGKQESIVAGNKIYIIKHRSKSSVLATSFIVDLAFPAQFKLTNEVGSDSFFKNLGLAKEFQTGDPEFDDLIYIASDSKSFFRKLTGDPTLRKTILKFFVSDAIHLKSDGRQLILKLPGDCSQNQEIKNELIALKDSINRDRTLRVGFLDDPFVWKAFITETLVWSFFGYASAGFMEWSFNRQDYHLDGMYLFQQGIIFGLLCLVFFFLVVILVFRGSSRGHRIIIESALLIGLCMPIAGVNMLSDLNINLDSQPSIIVHGQIINKEKREHRSKNGRYYTYYLYFNFDGAPSGLNVPKCIQVDPDVFNSASQASIAKIEVGPGFMGHPWYRSFSFD